MFFKNFVIIVVKNNIMSKLIKVCVRPGCEAVFHHTPKSVTKCNDCDGRIIIINEKTYWKKFSNNWFQYDYNTMEYYRPIQKI